MSSSSRSKRSKRSSSSSSSSYYPTQWSEWEWNLDQGRWQRYRLRAAEQYEYEYETTPSAAADPAEPRTSEPSLDPIAEGSYTASANYSLSSAHSTEGITRGLAEASLGSDTSSIPPRNQTPAGASEQTHITTINPYTDKEEFDPHYKVHKPFEFKLGRVFKVLWAEPHGSGGAGRGDGSSSNPETYTEGVNKFGEPSFQKVRRFVIIRPLAGHCICLPINTYSKQGVTKNGVHAGDHTAAYSGNKPVYFKGEKTKGLTKKPLKIVTKNPRHKLADTSRLNYAKTYTVEYNVKVWFIGAVDKDSMWHLVTDFNRMHPPLGTQGLPEPSPFQDEETSYAEGGDDQSYAAPVAQYPQMYSQRNYSSSYDASYDQSQGYQASSETYSAQSGSSHIDRRSSRSRGKGKGVQRDDIPEEDIPEGPEEQELGYERQQAYDDPDQPEYESQYDAYNQARHDEGDYARYESGPVPAPVAEEEPFEEELQTPPGAAEYRYPAGYMYPAAAEGYEHEHPEAYPKHQAEEYPEQPPEEYSELEATHEETAEEEEEEEE